MARGRGEGAAEDSFVHARKMSRGFVGHARCALLSSRLVSILGVFASVSSDVLYFIWADVVGSAPSAVSLARTGIYMYTYRVGVGVCRATNLLRFMAGRLFKVVRMYVANDD